MYTKKQLQQQLTFLHTVTSMGINNEYVSDYILDSDSEGSKYWDNSIRFLVEDYKDYLEVVTEK